MNDLIPAPGIAMVEPYFHRDAFAADLKKRTGLLYEPKTDNKSNFEGVPNRGYIYALPADYKGPHKVGDQVVFTDNSPKGFKWEDKTLFPIKIETIAATIVEDE